MSRFGFRNPQSIFYQISRDDNEVWFHTVNDLLKSLKPVETGFADMSIRGMDKSKRRTRSDFYKRKIDVFAVIV